jgi:hypothetical protein
VLPHQLSPRPASPSLRIATICDSVNLDLLMTSLVPRETTIYLCRTRGSLRENLYFKSGSCVRVHGLFVKYWRRCPIFRSAVPQNQAFGPPNWVP